MGDELTAKIPVEGLNKRCRIVYVIDEKTGEKTELTTIVDDNPRSRTYCTRTDCECLEADTIEVLEQSISAAGIKKISNAADVIEQRSLE